MRSSRAFEVGDGLDGVAAGAATEFSHPTGASGAPGDDVLRAALEHLPDRVVLRLLRPGALHLVVGPAAEQQRAAALAHPRAHVLALDVVEVFGWPSRPRSKAPWAVLVRVSVGARQ